MIAVGQPEVKRATTLITVYFPVSGASALDYGADRVHVVNGLVFEFYLRGRIWEILKLRCETRRFRDFAATKRHNLTGSPASLVFTLPSFPLARLDDTAAACELNAAVTTAAATAMSTVGGTATITTAPGTAPALPRPVAPAVSGRQPPPSKSIYEEFLDARARAALPRCPDPRVNPFL